MDGAFHKTKRGREPCVPFLRRPRPSLDSYTRGRGLTCLPQGVPNNSLSQPQHIIYYGPYQSVILRRTPYLLSEPRPCTHCQRLLPRTSEFYEDYARPLWGTTLCRSCHRKVHGARNLSP